MVCALCPKGHIYRTITSHWVHIRRLNRGSIWNFLQDLLEERIQWSTGCTCSKIACRILNAFSWVWLWQIQPCNATIKGFLSHVVRHFVAPVQDLLCWVGICVHVRRFSKLLILCGADIVFQMLGSLFFVGARVDSVEINTSKGRSSIDILNTKSLLSCAVEQKQRIIDFLSIARQMFKWGWRFWSTSPMSATVSVYGCRWNSCCLAHR